jgi:putative tryptophan/tyrosine transport system substrate-binding protein
MRPVIAAAALAVWLSTTILAIAQDTARLPLVAVLQIKTADNIDQTVATMLRDELKTLGHIDGKTFRLEFRLAEGDPARLSEIATALAREEPSVIVASGEAAIRAVQAATHTIPIVANANDLVASGLVASLAKPGGNITGVSMLITELDAKRLEMLKEILPSARRFGVLNDPAANGAAGLRAIADMARALDVSLLTVDVHNPAEIPPAFDSLRDGGVEGVNTLSSPLFSGFRERLGRLLLAHKLAAICEWREMAGFGCLASYGTTYRELQAMKAAQIDKILKGASPADTPVQQPTRFELVLNLKVGREIGVEIPPAILARADDVIE